MQVMTASRSFGPQRPRAGERRGVARRSRAPGGRSPTCRRVNQTRRRGNAPRERRRRPTLTDMHGVRNGLKTAVLFGLLGALFVVVGGAVAGSTGLVIGLVLAVGDQRVQLLQLRQDRAALDAAPARSARPSSRRCTASCASSPPTPGSRCRGCTSRRPRRPTRSPPAAARGTPRSAPPTGILQILDERELRAVLGHELSHVYNRDILISSVAGALAAGDHDARQLRDLLRAGGGDRDRNPFAAAADAVPRPARRRRSSSCRSAARASTRPTQSGAQLSADPLALASALRKLEAGTAARPLLKTPRLATTSHLMIANPFGGAREPVLHPPADGRSASPGSRQMADADPRYPR